MIQENVSTLEKELEEALCSVSRERLKLETKKVAELEGFESLEKLMYYFVGKLNDERIFTIREMTKYGVTNAFIEFSSKDKYKVSASFKNIQADDYNLSIYYTANDKSEIKIESNILFDYYTNKFTVKTIVSCNEVNIDLFENLIKTCKAIKRS